MQNKLQQGLRGGLISLNPWRPAALANLKPSGVLQVHQGESLSFLRRLPSCAHFAALGLLCGQGFAPCGRHFVPLTAQAIAPPWRCEGGSGGNDSSEVVHKQECRACGTPCYVQPQLPDVLTAGIRDNGNLARVYSAGNRGVGESGFGFSFHF